jgi:hypothetical protein
MAEEKFVRINVKEPIKREIDIIAASEGRHVYEIVDDALKLYKAVVVKKTARRKVKEVTMAEIVANH